jgi:hypothetical protein
VKGSGRRTGGRSNSRDQLKMITAAVATNVPLAHA